MFRPLLIAFLVMLTTAAGAQTVRQITLPTNDIVYDPLTQKIYASVPSSAGPQGNSIAAIDPVSGAVGPTVFVGSEPGKLALAADGTELYVALTGADAVRRFDPVAGTAGLQFSTGAIQDLQVVPGSPRSVAVAASASRQVGVGAAFGGVTIYDDGVARPNIHPSQGVQNAYTINSIAFSDTGTRLYGYDNVSSGFELVRLGVDAGGLSLLDSAGGIISGYGNTISFAGGRLYSADGQVADGENDTRYGTMRPAVVRLGGAYVVSNLSGVADPANKRFYVLHGDAGGGAGEASVVSYDTDTFLPVASLTVPNVSGRPGSLVRWGAHGLAFRTSGGQVFLVDTMALNALTGLSLAATTPSGGTTVTGTISLAAPAPAGGVTIWLNTSDFRVSVTPTLVVPAGASQASFTVTIPSLVATEQVILSADNGFQSREVALTVLGAANTPAYPADVKALLLPTNGLAYDAVTGQIYASVPSSAGGIGNSLTAIDPVAGAVGPSVWIGSEPGLLCSSDDGRYVYASLDGAGAIGRLDVQAMTADVTFPLGHDPFAGLYSATALAAMPGSPDTLAVVRGYNGGTALYDYGQPRPVTGPGGSSVAFADVPGRLYVYDGVTSANTFSRLDVTAAGLTTVSTDDYFGKDLLPGGGPDIRYAGGLIFADGGRVIDAEARAAVGTFAVTGAGVVAPDLDAGRVYFVTGGQAYSTSPSTVSLQSFDPRTFLLVNSRSIANVFGAPKDLVRWGAHGLAFRTTGGQVFLVNDPQFVPGDTAPTMTFGLSPVLASGGQTVQGTVSLSGPAPAGGVTVALSSSSSAVAMPATVSIPAGQSSLTFAITTQAVTVKTAAQITARASGASSSAGVTLLPAFHVQYPAGWNMISLPYDLRGASLDGIFGVPGVRLYAWSAYQFQYLTTPTAPADAIRLGQGYFVNFPQAVTVSQTGPLADITQDFPITLNPGWNQVGDPFTTPVPLPGLKVTGLLAGTSTSFVKALGASIFGPMGYTPGGGYSVVGANQSLLPGQGYWVYAMQPMTLTVPHP